jgi:hypothetical protein
LEDRFKSFKPFNRCAPFKPPFILTCDAGEERGGRLNGLNFLNDLNPFIS